MDAALKLLPLVVVKSYEDVKKIFEEPNHR